MQQKLFRKVALERISSPEQLDQLMKVVSPKSWQIAAAVGLLLLAMGIWGVTGQITSSVSAQGILVQPNINYLMAPSAGMISAIQVKVGDKVDAGQSVALLALPNTDTPAHVNSPYTGRIVAIEVDQGDFVAAGEPLFSIEQSEQAPAPKEPPPDSRLQALLYVPLDTSTKIRPCMAVQLVPAGVRTEEAGYLLGTVQSVRTLPVTQQEILRRTGNLALAQKLLTADNLVEVTVTLMPNAFVARAYAWSTAHGALTPLSAGMLTSGAIVIDQQAPVDLIIARASQPDNSIQPTSVPGNPCPDSGAR